VFPKLIVLLVKYKYPSVVLHTVVVVKESVLRSMLIIPFIELMSTVDWSRVAPKLLYDLKMYPVNPSNAQFIRDTVLNVAVSL
jgi:hypothetical protein